MAGLRSPAWQSLAAGLRASWSSSPPRTSLVRSCTLLVGAPHALRMGHIVLLCCSVVLCFLLSSVVVSLLLRLSMPHQHPRLHESPPCEFALATMLAHHQKAQSSLNAFSSFSKTKCDTTGVLHGVPNGGYGNGTTTSGTATARATYYAATLPGFAQPAPHALNSHGATPNFRGVDDSFRGEHDISRHFPRGSCHYPHRSCHQSRRNSANGAAGQNGTGKRNGLVQAGQEGTGTA